LRLHSQRREETPWRETQLSDISEKALKEEAMTKLLATLAIVALVAMPAMAREYVPWTGSLGGDNAGRADVVLEYDGGVDCIRGYGTSPGWTDLSVVNFQTPAGGPYTLAEAWYYVFGPNEKSAEIWAVGDLFAPPLGVGAEGIMWMPIGAAWPPGGWTVVDVTAYGITFYEGDLFGVGCDIFPDEGLGLADYLCDGIPGHSWAIYGGFWTDDTYEWGTDDCIRAGLNGPPSAADETTWGGVKALFK
jgi:hypothetical protein